MIYTAKVEEHGCGWYIRTITFEAESMQELDDLFLLYEEVGYGSGIMIDDSDKPEQFDSAGGFASSLISFVDENGNDCRNLVPRGIF